MDTNSFVLYSDVTAVYDRLVNFCGMNGFTVKENKDKYYAITATKNSLLFWRNQRMEIKILAVEKKKVEVNVMVFWFGIQRPGIEKEYRMAMEDHLSNSQQG